MALNPYIEAANARKASTKELPLNPDPNVLHKFASYNTMFTLSALSTREIRNPKLFFQSKPLLHRVADLVLLQIDSKVHLANQETDLQKRQKKQY